MFITFFLGVSAREKTSVYILNPCRGIGKVLKSLQGVNACKELGNILIEYNKTIVEFGFRMM